MEFKIDASINVLWQNLVALNSSLAKENEEKREQLISTKNQLQEEIEKNKVLRKKMEEQFVEHEKELLKKNKKISSLTSKLEMVRHVTESIFKDDDSESEIAIIEEDRNPTLKYIAAKQSGNQNSSHNQRKISNFFTSEGSISTKLESSTQESNNPQATPAAEINSNWGFRRNAVDHEELNDEDLLVPLQSSKYESPSKEVCKECGRKFTSLISFKRHVLLHTELSQNKFKSSEQQFTCSMCPKTFMDRNALNGHMHVHSDERLFACSKCTMTFRRSDRMKNHMKTHKKKIQPKKKHTKKGNVKITYCDECDSKFFWPHNLKRHKTNVHGKK